MSIKGLLIDSGGVLNGPVTGHWMITTNFFEVIDKDVFYKIDKQRRASAFSEAMAYINTIHVMHDLEEEYTHFKEHYSVLFRALPEIQIDEAGIEAITQDLVYNYEKYRFYDDANKWIPNLSEHYELAIVSDAWPSLRHVFTHNDFLKYFKSFIISCELGIRKPDELMYQKAVENFTCDIKEVAFIDDRLKNCDGAKSAGIEKTYLMCRWRLEYWFRKLTVRRHKVIRDFEELSMDLNRRKK